MGRYSRDEVPIKWGLNERVSHFFWEYWDMGSLERTVFMFFVFLIELIMEQFTDEPRGKPVVA